MRGRVPADASALDPDGDFAMLQILSLLDALECGTRFGHPELVFRVREDSDVWQANRIGHGSHRGLVLRTEEAGRRGTSRRRQACEIRFLIGEGSGG